MPSILHNPNKRIRIDDPRVEIPIHQLPISLLGHIATFTTIQDYAFSLLLTCKHFHLHLSPYKSPHIIKQLIQNQCYTILDDINPFINVNTKIGKERGINSKINDITPWRDWILSASYAWKNKAKIPRIQNRYIYCQFGPKPAFYFQDKHEMWINLLREDYNYDLEISNNYPTGDDNSSFAKDTQNSLLSSLYFLHFLYKVRFGGFNRLNEIKCLLEKLLFSYGGALGMRYMIWFFMKEFIYNPLKSGGKDAIMGQERYKMVFETVHGLFREYRLNIRCDIDHKKEWYIGQIFRDFDKVLSKYLEVVTELNAPNVERMNMFFGVFRSGGHSEWYNTFYD